MASSRFSVAVHTLALLARYDGEQPLKSEALACLVKTHAVVIRRLLSDLAAAGIVVSQAGATGGTRLAKKPEEIFLNEVYKVVENKQVFALHRRKPDAHCEIGRSIGVVLARIQHKLERAIDESLGKISLADVVILIEKENARCRERRS